MLLAGCALAPPSPAPSMLVVNRRPTVLVVLVNGILAGRLACGADLVLSPGTADLPALPWRLEVSEAGGVIGSEDLPSLGPIAIVTTAGVTMSMTGGPTFDPATECGGS